MSYSIQTVNLDLGVVLTDRKILPSDYVRSVNINQTTGDFVITKPLLNNGTIIVYPQSPNTLSSLLTAKKTLVSFIGYGFLSLPADARFDYTRNKIWIADMGNSRVLKVSGNNFLVDFSITNITLPFAAVPNVNNGGVFIRSFISTTTGVIYYYSSNGVLNATITFDDSFGGSSLTPVATRIFMNYVPLPSTMVFDYSRSRLWWTAINYVYMADLNNNQVVSFYLSGYKDSRGIDIENESGNAFAVIKSNSDEWYIGQIYRDNNRLISTAYVSSEIFTY